VLRGKGLPQHIYQEGSRQANPYDTGLRLKIERTVVNVSLDTPIDLDAQTSRQLVSPAGPRARGANTLAPAGTVVEGSVTPPSPFHHSPQLASNGDANLPHLPISRHISWYISCTVSPHISPYLPISRTSRTSSSYLLMSPHNLPIGDARFNYPPSMSLPSNCAPSGASMPPGVGAMLQPPQRPPARPTAFA